MSQAYVISSKRREICTHSVSPEILDHDANDDSNNDNDNDRNGFDSCNVHAGRTTSVSGCLHHTLVAPLSFCSWRAMCELSPAELLAWEVAAWH